MSAIISFIKKFCIIGYLLLLVLPTPIWAKDININLGNDDKKEDDKKEDDKKDKDKSLINLNDIKWKYHKGDDLQWATATFDDSSWTEIEHPYFEDPAIVNNWPGMVWLRLHLKIDPQYINKPLQLEITYLGAAQIYLNGEKVLARGKITPELHSEEAYDPTFDLNPIVFSQADTVIAIRYSYWQWQYLAKERKDKILEEKRLGISASIESIEETIKNAENTFKVIVPFLTASAGGLIVLSLVHFLIFAFYRRAIENLYYSLFVGAWGVLYAIVFCYILLQFNNDLSESLWVFLGLMLSIMFLSLSTFLYKIFYGEIPKYLIGFALVYLTIIGTQILVHFAIAGISILIPEDALSIMQIALMAAIIIDSIRVVLLAVWRKKQDAWLFAIGMFSFPLVAILTAILITIILTGIGNKMAGVDYIIIPMTIVLSLIAIYGFPISVSVYLARTFARTNIQLANQVIQIKDLSTKQLEQERREAELRLVHEQEQARSALLEAENERKEKELEEARILQLSLLPKKLPDLPNLEIAAYLKPATEVGGDYYDFALGLDNTLTVAIGDATGHGLKAGTLVTVTKGLFNILASEPNIPLILQKSSLAIKQMNFRTLFMALTILKIKDNQVRISCAGMPPLLVAHAHSGLVETISLNGMPLGGVKFPYKEQLLEVGTGDTLLLMSDGFPEQFNPQGEILGYDTAIEEFKRISQLPAQAIIDALIAVKDSWAADTSQNDDITFVVIKIK